MTWRLGVFVWYAVGMDQNNAPRYRQIEADMRRRLLEGEWAAGEPLPPLRVLCEQYDCTGTMLRQALGPLQRAGALEGQQGRANIVVDPDLARDDDDKQAWREFDSALKAADAALEHLRAAAQRLRTSTE